jgi:hypothetical protein
VDTVQHQQKFPHPLPSGFLISSFFPVKQPDLAIKIYFPPQSLLMISEISANFRYWQSQLWNSTNFDAGLYDITGFI